MSVLQIHKFSSISSAIRDELHWLPVRSQIVFKQCLLVRSCMAGSAPSYLAELCILVSSVTDRRQNLRSTSRGTLVVPRVRTERYGRRGFSVSGPHLWNSLPPRICSFIEKPDLSNNSNNNNNTQLVTRHMSVNAYSYIYERTESQARTGRLSVTVGFIVQMSFKLFFKRLLC